MLITTRASAARRRRSSEPPSPAEPPSRSAGQATSLLQSLDMWPWLALAELESFAPNPGPSRDNMISAFDSWGTAQIERCHAGDAFR